METKADLEKLFLIAFFSIMLFVGLAGLWDYKLKHDFPYGYMASDTFQHQIRAESIKEMGNYRNEAFYIVAGYKDNIGFYQPVLYHLGVIFSYLSGLETYDSTYFLVFVLSIFGALTMYLIIRDFNRHIAIISLPLSILIFSRQTMIAITWGHWPAITAQYFLLAMLFCVSKIKLEKSYVLLGIILSGAALTHTSEAIFGVLFIAFFFSVNLILKKVEVSAIKNAAIGGILFFIISLYYLIIFKFTWAKMQPYKFGAYPVWTGQPAAIYLINFGAIFWLILAGFIASLALLKKKNNFAVLAAVFMLLAGFGNYAGFSWRAFQIRFFWPIYLSFFVGLVVYYILNYSLKFFIKKWSILYSVIIAALALFLFSNAGISSALHIPAVAKFGGSPGIMDPYHWETFQWIRQNTPLNSTVYFFYGDIYNQNAMLRNTHRVHYLVDPRDYAGALNNMTVKREYLADLPGDSHGVNYAYRKSLFSYGYHALEVSDDFFYKQFDICNMDYYIFDRASREPVLAQYNMAIRELFLKTGFMEEVFSNSMSSVLKNNRPYDECLPKEGVKIG